MKLKLLATLTGLLLAAGPALSQNVTPTLRPLLGVGFTTGGDRLATFVFNNGDESTVRAGGLVELKAGLVWRAVPQVSWRATLGYHVDSSSARNGSFTFSRFPLELIGSWHPDDQVRIGAGARKALGASVSGTGIASGLDTDFRSDLGVVVEGEYALPNLGGIYLRVVGEKYRSPFGEVSGNHVGAGINFYF